MSDGMDEVTVPVMLIGIALLAYAGFFTAAREWVRTRVGKTDAPVPQQSGPPEVGNPGAQGSNLA